MKTWVQAHELCKNLGTGVSACNFSIGEIETDGTLGLAGRQSGIIGKPQIPVRDPASKKQSKHLRLTSGFHMFLHMHRHLTIDNPQTHE